MSGCGLDPCQPISRVVSVPALRAGILAHAQYYGRAVLVPALCPPCRTMFV
jgi:hypothetical protein